MRMHNPPHPGRSLKEALEAIPMTVTAFAKHIGVSRGALPHRQPAGRLHPGDVDPRQPGLRSGNPRRPLVQDAERLRFLADIAEAAGRRFRS